MTSSGWVDTDIPPFQFAAEVRRKLVATADEATISSIEYQVRYCQWAKEQKRTTEQVRQTAERLSAILTAATLIKGGDDATFEELAEHVFMPGALDRLKELRDWLDGYCKAERRGGASDEHRDRLLFPGVCQTLQTAGYTLKKTGKMPPAIYVIWDAIEKAMGPKDGLDVDRKVTRLLKENHFA